MLIVRQSTARTVTVGPVLDADGVAVTTATVGDFKLSKNGGAPAALNGSATLTHRNTGHYSLALTTSDTDTIGSAEVVIDATTNACPPKELSVLDEAVYDVLFGTTAPSTYAGADTSGTTTLLSRIGGAITITSGRVNADVTHIAAAAVSTSTAQLGVNVVNFGGSAGTFASGVPAVNATQISGDSVAADNLEAAADGTGYNLGGGSVVAASVTGAVGSVTGNVGGSVASVAAAGISASSIATGAITSAKFAAGAIDSAAIATDAIGSAQVAASAVTEIQSGLATAASLATVAGYLDTEVAAILADTDALEQRLNATRAGYLDNLSGGAVALASGVRLAAGVEHGGTGATLVLTNAAGPAFSATGSTYGLLLSGGTADLIGFGTGTAEVRIVGNIDGDISGKVLGTTAGGGTISGIGAWALGSAGATISTLTPAQVNTECDTALADYDAPTNAEMVARTLAAAGYATAASQTTIEGKVDTVDTVVDAVKVKTDQLTFTVANQVDANAESINAVAVVGAGTSGNKWRA